MHENQPQPLLLIQSNFLYRNVTNFYQELIQLNAKMPKQRLIVIVLSALIFTAVRGVPSPTPPPSVGNPCLQQETADEDQRQLPTTTTAAVAEEQDYAEWNPSPYFGGGGYGAPIPHAKEACTSPPQSSSNHSKLIS